MRWWSVPLALWRLLLGVLHLLHGVLIVALRFPGLDEAARAQRIQWWSAKVLRVAGIRLQVHGQPRAGATLLIANHVSWLDISVIHAASGRARFVSKADVLRWPVLGWLIRSVGTLFIERERKRDAVRVVHELAAALQRGEMVAVFPEGTTGEGARVLPFHANLLQAAIATEAPVQAAVLRFHQPGERFSAAAAYVGEMTLLDSIWRVVTARGLVAELHFLPPQATAHADRRALSEHLRQQVQDALDAC